MIKFKKKSFPSERRLLDKVTVLRFSKWFNANHSVCCEYENPQFCVNSMS